MEVIGNPASRRRGGRQNWSMQGDMAKWSWPARAATNRRRRNATSGWPTPWNCSAGTASRLPWRGAAAVWPTKCATCGRQCRKSWAVESGSLPPLFCESMLIVGRPIQTQDQTCRRLDRFFRRRSRDVEHRVGRRPEIVTSRLSRIHAPQLQHRRAWRDPSARTLCRSY